MLFEDFRAIQEYFQARGLGTRKAHLAYGVYIDNVEAAVRQQNLQEKLPSDPKVRAICKSYLTNQSLDSMIIVVEKREDSERRNSSPWKGFVANVVTGLVSNLLFGLIVVLIYFSIIYPSDAMSLAKSAADPIAQQPN